VLFLKASTELVLKTFACLEDLVTHREVAVSAEVLAIKIIKFLRVLCVKNVTEIDGFFKYDISIVVIVLNFCLLWFWCGYNVHAPWW
jgi:hypothetical protein